MKSIAGRAAGRLAGTAIAAGIQFVTYILLARTLGVAAYGVFAAAFAVGSFTSVLAGAGFTHRALRIRAETAGRALIVSTMVAYRIFLALVLGFGVGALAMSIGAPVISCTIAAAFIIIDGVTDICQAALAGAERLALATTLLVTQRALVLASAAAFSAGMSASWLSLPAALIVAVNSAVVIRQIPRPSLLVRLVRTSTGYWLANLAASISQLETPLIALVGIGSSAGLYGAASRAGGPVNLLAQAILLTATPTLSGAESTDRLRIFSRMRIITWCIAAVAGLLAIPAGFAGAWLLGAGFESSWPIIAGFVVGGALMGVNQAHQALLLAQGRASAAASAIGIGATVALVYAGLCAALLPIPWLALTPVIAQLVMQAGLARAVAATASIDVDPELR